MVADRNQINKMLANIVVISIILAMAAYSIYGNEINANNARVARRAALLCVNSDNSKKDCAEICAQQVDFDECFATLNFN